MCSLSLNIQGQVPSITNSPRVTPPPERRTVGGTGDASAPASVEGERREAEAAGTVVGRARAGAGRGLAAGRAPWRRAVVA